MSVGHPTPLPPPLHAVTPQPRSPRSRTMPSVERSLRRRPGRPNSTRQASATPPAYQGVPRVGRVSAVQDPACEAVVTMVSVAVPAPLPETLTGLVDPKLKVGG